MGLFDGPFGGGGRPNPRSGIFGGGAGGPDNPDAVFNVFGITGQNNRSPVPWPRGYLDPETARNVRKRARYAYTPTEAALQAGLQLLPSSINYSRRAGAAQLGLLGEFLPQYLDAYRNANPDTAALLAQLTQGASQLTSPSYTNPYEDRLLQQSVRSAQSARGMGYGTGDALNELLALDRAREGRTMQRGQYGLDVTEAGRQFYSPVIGGVISQYQNPAQMTSLDDLTSMVLREKSARDASRAARIAGNQALWGSVISAIGGAAGSYLGRAR